MKISDIQLSSAFKKQTKQAILAILFFTLTYLIILVLAVALTILCIYGGIALIANFPRFITIALGIGLASLGVLILIFLLKFMFKAHKVDRSHLIEIKRTQEPELFKMIDSIVEEVGTTSPKKVYLSNEVNAAVFYDSSFWSMFLPIRKNLLIGLGLVNTVTEEELKAILSHEFGHFSQKTMKVGSYVYNVNKVIYNMLYENDSYDSLVQQWANVSSYFAIFAIIAVRIINGVQWILKQLYNVVNKSYMALSREMEFHADEIASIVTGYTPLKTSLLRMPLASEAHNAVLGFYTDRIEKNEKTENIFNDQFFVFQFLAKEKNIPFVNEFPAVSQEEMSRFDKSKLVIKDQWASHPSTEDRIKRMEERNHKVGSIGDIPANKLFQDIDAWQKMLTSKLFEGVNYTGEVIQLSTDEFEKAFKVSFEGNSLPKIFNGYYDDHNPPKMELRDLEEVGSNQTMDSLFGSDKVDIIYQVRALQMDIDILNQIISKTVQIKTFDYDGKKYQSKDAKGLVAKLQTELQTMENLILENDKQVYQYFRKLEEGTYATSELATLYSRYFLSEKEIDDNFEIYTKLQNELHFISEVTQIDQIKANFLRIERTEKTLKDAIQKILEDEKYQADISKDMRENFETYISKQLIYFRNESYVDNNLGILFLALNNFILVQSKGHFALKKRLLDYMEKLLLRRN